MEFEYTLDAIDFIDFQLFAASKSERINKKKRNSWILWTLASLLISFYFYNTNEILAIYFIIVAIVSAIFYPMYFKSRYKKHYTNFVIENYSKRFGEKAKIEIDSDFISTADKTGYGKINISEIEKIDETSKHFFLKFSTGLTLIIPKNKINNLSKLRSEFERIGLIINDELNWKW